MEKPFAGLGCSGKGFPERGVIFWSHGLTRPFLPAEIKIQEQRTEPLDRQTVLVGITAAATAAGPAQQAGVPR